MAKYKSGVLGNFSGKVGNVVGSFWRGIPYMRSLPDYVHNPNTPAQQTQREKFSLTMAFLQKIRPVVDAGFISGKTHQTRLNSAASYNIRKAAKGTAPDVEIDFEAVMVSKGTLVPALEATAASGNPGEVSFTWADNSGIDNARADDQVLLVLYNASRDRAIYHTENGPLREDASFVMDVPAAYAGDKAEAYIGFVSADGSIGADSVYLGSLTLAEV
jgi:hypothetical protein